MVSRYRDGQPRTNPGVLVVDEEKKVRDLLETSLKREGFDVWLAGGRSEAVNLYELHHDTIVAVLLNADRSDLESILTLHALHRVDPDVRCCYMAGENGCTRTELLEQDVVTVFSKPIRLTTVTEVLRHLAYTSHCQVEA